MAFKFLQQIIRILLLRGERASLITLWPEGLDSLVKDKNKRRERKRGDNRTGGIRPDKAALEKVCLEKEKKSLAANKLRIKFMTDGVLLIIM